MVWNPTGMSTTTADLQLEFTCKCKTKVLPHSDYANVNIFLQQLHPLNAPPLSTCETGRLTQVEYIQELWIAVWYLMNDLKESKLELSP